MKLLLKTIAIAWISILGFGINAQDPVVFYEAEIDGIGAYSSNLSLATGDLNGDFRDDLIINSDDTLLVYIQIENGEHFLISKMSIGSSQVYSTNIADLDNDGKNEIILALRKEGLKIYEWNEGTFDLSLRDSISADYVPQGSSLADFDGDGDLDFFLSNDIGPNVLYGNSDGQLNPIQALGLDVLSESESAGNYNAIWLDVENDGDQDLFIAKCFATATEATDPRRINQFFINEGNGVFREEATDMGLASGVQSWCSDAGDLDNDGDLDLILINHGAATVIYENIDGFTFTEHNSFADSGPILSDDSQVSLADFNNDGLLDIIIAGMNDRILLNKGDFTFTDNQTPFPFGNASSFTIGDFNNDGFPDVYAVYGNDISGINDRLWINLPLFSSSTTINLVGHESNYSAVGTKLHVYIGDKRLFRTIQSGLGYGISNTNRVSIGHKSTETIDSVLIEWPSGISEMYFDFEDSTHYIINESRCKEELLQATSINPYLNCTKDVSIALNTNQLIEWSNGDLQEQFNPNSSGLYYARQLDSTCVNRSQYFSINEATQIALPELGQPNNIQNCIDTIYMNTQQDSLYWTELDFNSQWSIVKGESYNPYVFNECDTFFHNDVRLEDVSFQYSDIYDTISSLGTYQLSIQDEGVEWFTINGEPIDLGLPSSIEVESDTCLYFQETLPSIINPESIGPHEDSLVFLDASGFINLKFDFDIMTEGVTLMTTDLVANTEGKVKLLIEDVANGSFVFEREYDLNSGKQTIELNVFLPRGSYSIYFDESVNLNSFGTSGPQLDEYDHVFGSNSFWGSFINQDAVNFYLFNWNIIQGPEYCVSGLKPYCISLDTTVSTQTLEDQDFNIYPNPVSGDLIIEFDNEIIGLEIFYLVGRKLISEPNVKTIHQIDISHLVSGQYILKLNTLEGRITKSFIKI